LDQLESGKAIVEATSGGVTNTALSCIHPPNILQINKELLASSVAVHASAVFLCHSACKVISCWTLCCLANVLVTFW